MLQNVSQKEPDIAKIIGLFKLMKILEQLKLFLTINCGHCVTLVLLGKLSKKHDHRWI